MREWVLSYVIIDPKKDWEIIGRGRHFKFTEKSDKEALKFALKKLQTNLKRTKWWIATIFLTRRHKTEKHFDKLYRVKSRFENRRLLRIRNPQSIFVEGLGPKALKKLDRGL